MMNEEELKNLKRAIIAASAYYGRQLADDAIRMYVMDLQDLPYKQVVEAMKKYRMNTANRQLFLPAHIREIIFPSLNSKDLARLTAARITEAISKFGWSNAEGAKAHIGDEGWKHVQRAGGWLYLCENMGLSLSPTTFLAQARDSIESEINLQRAGVDTSLPAIEQAQQREQLNSNQDRLGAVVKELTTKLSMKGEENVQTNNHLTLAKQTGVRDGQEPNQ